MGDISNDFSREEFGCNCKYEDCVDIAVDVELVKVLQDCRDYFDKGITITSSYRCKKHNKDVGGVTHSKHRLGIAADIVVSGTHPHVVYEYLDKKYKGKYGIGKYGSFTHIDVRAGEGRWG